MAADAEPMDLSDFITGEWSEPRPTSFNTRDLLAYAVGIGCTEMKFVYESAEDFAAFPLYPVVLASHKGDTQDVDSEPCTSLLCPCPYESVILGAAHRLAVPADLVGGGKCLRPGAHAATSVRGPDRVLPRRGGPGAAIR